MFPELQILNRLWQAVFIPSRLIRPLYLLFSLAVHKRALCHDDQGCSGSRKHQDKTVHIVVFYANSQPLRELSQEKKNLVFSLQFIFTLIDCLQKIVFYLTASDCVLKRRSPDAFNFLFEAGAARVQRSTSTTAPGSTFLVTTCVGCSHSCCSSSSSVRSQRASSPMGMFVMNGSWHWSCDWKPLYSYSKKMYSFIHLWKCITFCNQYFWDSSLFMMNRRNHWDNKDMYLVYLCSIVTWHLFLRVLLTHIVISSETILDLGWQVDTIKSN